MGEILTAPDIGQLKSMLDIYWGLSPVERADYDAAEKKYRGDDLEGFMEEYFEEKGFM